MSRAGGVCGHVSAADMAAARRILPRWAGSLRPVRDRGHRDRGIGTRGTGTGDRGSGGIGTGGTGIRGDRNRWQKKNRGHRD